METNPQRIVYKPDARHAGTLMNELRLEQSTGVETPAVHCSEEKQIADSKTTLLESDMKKKFKSCVMPTAYMAQDDPSIAETVKSLARGMSSPSEADLQQLERVGKYLVEYPTVAFEFVAQNMLEQVTVYVDTNHAGCALTRRSTTLLATMLGRQCVRHASNVQTTIALSGGESARPWVHLEVLPDSSGARGMTSRQGLGRARHIQARCLWVQKRVREGHLPFPAR